MISWTQFQMKTPSLPLLFLCLVILSTGCATNSVLVTAQRDSNFFPTPTDRINMSRRPNPSAEDAMLGSLLASELARQHFNIVTNPDAEYTLTYLVEDDSTATYIPSRHYAVLPPNETIGLTQPIATITPLVQDPAIREEETAAPVMVVYHAKGIRLYLLANPKRHPGGLQIAWQGCVEAGTAISPDHEAALIRALLEHFGTDFSGKVTLAQ